MKKFLAIILILVMLVSMLTACGGTNNDTTVNNGDNNANNNSNNNSNKEKQDIEDVYYEPELENLVGLAIYPVDDRNDYPYEIGEKVTDFSDWKYLYCKAAESEDKEPTAVFDDNIVAREFKNEYYYGLTSVCSGEYVSTKDFYWGYVYTVNNETFIIATHDFADWSEGPNTFSEIKHINAETVYVRLDILKINESMIPESYVFDYVWHNMIYDNSYMQETYTNETLPKEIILPDAKNVNNVRVHEYHNGAEIEINELGHTRICHNDLSYQYDVVKNGGHYTWEFNGFKDGESYQYYIEVTHPDYVDNGQN